MLNRISVRLVKEMMQRVKDVNCSEDVYVYGVELILSTVIGVTGILASALLFSAFIESVVFLMIFVPVRIFAGGYHAQTYRRCFCLTVGAFWVTFFIRGVVTDYVSTKFLYQIFYLVCIYIIIRSPVINKHQPLSIIKRGKNMKMTAIILVCYLYIFNFYICKNNNMLNMAIFTVYTVAILMFAVDCINIKRRKEYGIFSKSN